MQLWPYGLDLEMMLPVVPDGGVTIINRIQKISLNNCTGRCDVLANKELKIGDISRITGIPEKDVRKYTEVHKDRFSFRMIGKVKLFNPKAVDVVRELAESDGSLNQEPLPEKPRANPAARSGTATPAPFPQPMEMVIGVQAMSEGLAHLHLRIDKLAEKIEGQSETIELSLAGIRESVDLLGRQFEAQQKQIEIIGDWIAYFDGQLDGMKRPLIEKIRRNRREGA